MATYACSHCSAHSPAAGRCIVCGENLGSLRRGVAAAAAATLGMMALWFLLTVVVRLQVHYEALIFGAAVAGLTSHFSGGRHGWRIQLIATTFTVVGIILADSISMIAITIIDDPTVRLRDIHLPAVPAYVVHSAINDPFTTLFYCCGIVSSFFIWRK